ncbi:MAG: GNAT family N-acetyltransferase [Bacteroidetes bacterium]|nr:GNAT family N-acetyltransferase [Bacteroidota bacterium]
MTSIIKATAEDCGLLSEIGRKSFTESHGRSAAKEDIESYLNENYSRGKFENELSDPGNIYHIIYSDNKPSGYSKIILNFPAVNIPEKNITKMERLYLLKEFYGLNLGLELFNFNTELSVNNAQKGMWLYVWKENHRAVSFYKKAGFKIVGSHDFRISENHSNPNHQMYLKY